MIGHDQAGLFGRGDETGRRRAIRPSRERRVNSMKYDQADGASTAVDVTTIERPGTTRRPAATASRLGRGVVLALGFLLSSNVVAGGQEGREEGRWISLFNGKDLDGWTVKIKGYAAGENYGNTFRVEDGLLKVSYDQYTSFDEKFGHIFTKHPYSNYRMRVEYRFVGDQCPGGPSWAIRNNGVMIHGQSPER